MDNFKDLNREQLEERCIVLNRLVLQYQSDNEAANARAAMFHKDNQEARLVSISNVNKAIRGEVAGKVFVQILSRFEFNSMRVQESAVVLCRSEAARHYGEPGCNQPSGCTRALDRRAPR